MSEPNAAQIAKELEIGMLGRSHMQISARELRALLTERRELLARQVDGIDKVVAKAFDAGVKTERQAMVPLLIKSLEVIEGYWGALEREFGTEDRTLDAAVAAGDALEIASLRDAIRARQADSISTAGEGE